MKWEKVNRELYRMVDNNTHQVAEVFYSYTHEDWAISFMDWCSLLDANTLEEALWKATLKIYNRCNEIANVYHRIRDNLPDIRNLAKVAGVV